MAVTTSTVRTLSALLEARTGQQLIGGRQWRVETALTPLAREVGLANVDALAARVVGDADAVGTTRVIEALLNNETSFFRDLAMFDQVNTGLFDRLRSARRETKRLRIWSAGCSTGQEAYSLAMLIAEAPARWADWSIDIAATDISGAAITQARRGRYSQFEIQRGLAARTMLRWFEQDGRDWVVDHRLRRMIRFAQASLLLPAPGEFDIILCRNVLMYFAPSVRAGVFAHLAQALAPDGILVLGAGETVIGQTDRFTVAPDLRGCYQRVAEPASTERRAA